MDSLEEAIEDAARRLPVGWQIDLVVEFGSAVVTLDGPDGSSHTDFPRESLVDEISEAVDHALAMETLEE